MSAKNEQGGTNVKEKNVYSKPLHQHSSSSSNPTSSAKTGFCTSIHPIAAILTDSFLEFSASYGTDLRAKGVQPGARLCIETSRWREAVQHYGGKDGKDVPRVKLECTHVEALKEVGIEELKKFGAELDNSKGGVAWPSHAPSQDVRESGSIGGKEPKS